MHTYIIFWTRAKFYNNDDYDGCKKHECQSNEKDINRWDHLYIKIKKTVDLKSVISHVIGIIFLYNIGCNRWGSIWRGIEPWSYDGRRRRQFC